LQPIPGRLFASVPLNLSLLRKYAKYSFEVFSKQQSKHGAIWSVNLRFVSMYFYDIIIEWFKLRERRPHSNGASPHPRSAFFIGEAVKRGVMRRKKREGKGRVKKALQCSKQQFTNLLARISFRLKPK